MAINGKNKKEKKWNLRTDTIRGNERFYAFFFGQKFATVHIVAHQKNDATYPEEER